MASARKRPRVENEENRAECPFSVRIVDPKDKEQKKNKKRRRTEGGEDDDVEKKSNLQLSPFSPSGKFKTYGTMDVHYQVDPAKKWTDMTRYNSFVLNGVKYFSEGFIYVANDSSIERQRAMANNEPVQTRKKSDDDWVARILEIRASDEHHVYARVYWMYWPDELPQGTHDGKRTVHGRQPYHGINELIASNHMDIINVVSVTSPATVKQWYEQDEDDMQQFLYWRQAFDVRTYELSTVDLVCSCNTPEHPDKRLIGCTSDSCKRWMHEECIKEEAFKATYKQLGTDKPHLPTENGKLEKESLEAKRPLSPTETGAGISTQPSIDVKSEVDATPLNGIHLASDNVDVKQADDEDAIVAPEDQLPGTPGNVRMSVMSGSVAARQSRGRDSETPSKATPSKSTPGRKAGRPKKKAEANGSTKGGGGGGGRSNGVASGSGAAVGTKPWEGLFEVSLQLESPTPMLQFKDLREGIVGGEKTWTEPIKCLVCGCQIN